VSINMISGHNSPEVKHLILQLLLIRTAVPEPEAESLFRKSGAEGQLPDLKLTARDLRLSVGKADISK
jgi:hypothetical protein